MKKTAIAIFLLAASWLASPVARASTHVSHCIQDNGSSLYTDGSCMAVGGRPAPMSETLVRALVREGALGDQDFQSPAGSGAPNPVPVDPGKATHRLGEGFCPRTPAELASALRNSLGGGEVSRLAALYDWTGRSSGEAKVALARLERMSERPLLEGQYFAAGDGGTVQLVQGVKTSATVTEVAVKRNAGCLLLAL